MDRKICRILIANRGEIAVRIIRACRDLGITSIGVYSDADHAALHVRMADEAYHIGPSPASQSYLVHEKIIETAKNCHADAIHPGYGFLSENAVFAQKVVDAGIIFIGPKPETIALLGDKLAARETALKAGLTVTPGASLDGESDSAALRTAERVGFPLLVKAAAGGGGKGMRIVRAADEFAEALAGASREAKSAFGDGRVYIERYLARPRHIEIQILCDRHGHAIHLGERECSIQRRHQKVIEESPSPIMTPDLRARMGEAAVQVARQSGYVGAGTVEFLVDEDRSFYFLEVNTRLQVEHPVTEMVTGLDLVAEQIAIAEGEPLRYRQEDIRWHGHAIECRIYAEDPEENFMPSTGTIRNYRVPAGPGVRLDDGVVINAEIPIYYDPIIAKLIAWGRDREEAIRRARRALEEYRLGGVKSTIGFHQAVLRNPRFLAGDLSTRFLEEEYPGNTYIVLDEHQREQVAIAAALDAVARERRISVRNGHTGKSAQSGWATIHRRRNLKQFTGSR